MNLIKKLGGFFGGISNQASGVSQPAQWLVEWIAGGKKSSSGQAVNEVVALGLTAYLACIKNISEDVAKVPFGVYERLQPRGRASRHDHPAHFLLHDEANEEMSAMSFREALTAHALGWHGGFSEIVRDGQGVTKLYPLDPTGVQVCRTNDRAKRLYYLVHGIPFESRDIFHIHGLGYDGLTGYVLARLASDAIGNALASQEFSGSFFANGTVASGVIKVPGTMTDTAFKHLRESFHERHGGANNQHRPVILEEGTDFTPTSSDPQKSQMTEVLQHGTEEVARLFRMPPHKIGHLLRSTNNNIEHQGLEYVQDTLLAWYVRWEQEANRKLLMPRERRTLFTKHNVNMLMRGDMSARSAFYREGFNIGSLSVNDIREYEDLNPVEGGNTHFVNAAMVPLHLAATGEHLATQRVATEAEGGDDDKDSQASLDHKRDIIARIGAAHTKTIEEAIAGLLRVEHDKVCRAAKKDGFQAWADGFYGDSHRNEVVSRLSPAITALSESLGAVAWM